MTSTFVFSRDVRALKIRFMWRNCTKSHTNSRLTLIASGMDLSDKTLRDNLKYIKEFIPVLSTKLRKGECGRIGVVGGSQEYTGAPFYAAISSLKLGADIAYIICCKDAAAPIKSYSPAVIVYPYLDHSDVVYKATPLLERVHCLVIGPGLGRAADVLRNVEAIINYCNFQMATPIPLIFDADGLFLVTENPDLIRDYKGLVFLTPNAIEYARMCDKMGMKDQQIIEMSRLLNVVILKKGEVDMVTNGFYQRILKLQPEHTTAMNRMMGSKRRCAGQGDILAGCMATLVTWYILHKRKQMNTSWNDIFVLDPTAGISKWDADSRKKVYDEKFRGFTAAAFGASLIARQASYLAYNKIGRSMTACDIIPYLANAFNQFFGSC